MHQPRDAAKSLALAALAGGRVFCEWSKGVRRQAGQGACAENKVVKRACERMRNAEGRIGVEGRNPPLGQ